MRGCSHRARYKFVEALFRETSLTRRSRRLERGDVAPDEAAVTLKLVGEVASAEGRPEARDVEHARRGSEGVRGLGRERSAEWGGKIECSRSVGLSKRGERRSARCAATSRDLGNAPFWEDYRELG